jgi:hypothetical protein
MITLQQVAAVSTIVGVVLAVPALLVAVVQLRQRGQLNARDKMIRVYFDCTETYANLQRERAEFEDLGDGAVTSSRRQRNRIAFWDLLAAEYEFAIAQLLPIDVYVEWFALVHDALHGDGVQLAGEGIRESWSSDGAPFAGRIFPRFSALMSLALEERDLDTVREALRHRIRDNARLGLFRALQ